MVEFISNLIGNDIIATSVMSLIPMIELKGGIVFARGAGLGFLLALALAYVGSTIVFIPIYFLLRPILNVMKKVKWFNKFACKVEGFFQKKADDTMEKQGKESKRKMSKTLLKQLGVFIFVAIPLPLTGIWTGTAIAVFLNLKFKDVILPVMLGNLVAGLIISGLAELFLAIWTIKALDYVLYGLFALALILLTITIIKVVKQKPAEQQTATEEIEEDK